MKRFIGITLFFLLLLSPITLAQTAIAQESDSISVNLFGNQLTFDQPPVIEDGRTLVPMRAIFEAFGATVQWDEKAQSIVANKGATQINLQIGSVDAYNNNSKITLDVPPKIINGRTLVPVRFIAESLGANVEWDEGTRSVFIKEKRNETDLSKPTVQIEMENGKTIVIELYPQYAPKTVANFVDLVKRGFYNGLIFHRVIKGFMIQGGDPTGTGTGGSEKTVEGEFAENDFAQNTLLHIRGVISMARTNDPNSATSQFFITHAATPFLDGKYAAFGKVISGMDVVDEIAETPVDPSDKPVNVQKMKAVTVLAD